MRNRISEHPNLASWAVLALGMVAILAWSARDVGLLPSQWFWLAVATVLLAGLCTWIISWEVDEDEDLDDEPSAPAASATEAAQIEASDSGSGERA